MGLILQFNCIRNFIHNQMVLLYTYVVFFNACLVKSASFLILLHCAHICSFKPVGKYTSLFVCSQRDT